MTKSNRTRGPQEMYELQGAEAKKIPCNNARESSRNRESFLASPTTGAKASPSHSQARTTSESGCVLHHGQRSHVLTKTTFSTGGPIARTGPQNHVSSSSSVLISVCPLGRPKPKIGRVRGTLPAHLPADELDRAI